MKQKKMSWIIRALFVLPVAAPAAYAQTTPAPAGPEVQQVTVSGLRASLRSALDRKESSNSMVEVIASEDIGKLPDTTIAESLAKLPGISTGVDRGNASQIIARGLDTRFVSGTINGREIASADPGRAVRFDQFPAESISGAVVNKTTSAELIEGGISTTVDLQTIQPLSMKERAFTLKADGLYYAMSRDIPNGNKIKPRLGAVYVDQFLNHTLGVTLAGSYQKQPGVRTNVDHWGFNETNSVDLTSDGKVDKTPWGFADTALRGKNDRSSVLGKVEWKPEKETLITADIYYAKADLAESAGSHYYQNLGNWDGGDSARYSNVNVRDGYVVGATVRDVYLHTDSSSYHQKTSNLAGGLNAKFRLGEWKADADVSTSVGEARSVWRDVIQDSRQPGVLTWNFPGGDVQNYTYTSAWDQADPASYGAASSIVADPRHLKDRLNALQLNASRPVEWGDFSRVKIGVRATDREKWLDKVGTYNPAALTAGTAVPSSAYDVFRVPGFNQPFMDLKDFDGTFTQIFGDKSLDTTGRVHDLAAEWRVTEKTESAYGQLDLDGTLFGHGYRGNVGVRYVHTSQKGYGNRQINGGPMTPVSDGISYNNFLPSSNIVFNLDESGGQQLRLGLGRAMARPSIDELRASASISEDLTRPGTPLSGTAGNPRLKPMIANQFDIAYQNYFGKSSLLSAALFFKDIKQYIGLKTTTGTFEGRNSVLYQSVNTDGGQVRGAEFIYQQAFTMLPAPFDGLGVNTSYTYTESNIKEPGDGVNPFNLSGLIKNNAGVMLWYEKSGFDARLSANYKSKATRNPYWTAAEGFVTDKGATWVSLGMSQNIGKNWNVHVGVDNLTNQRTIFQTGPVYSQQIEETGRRYNFGVSYKL